MNGSLWGAVAALLYFALFQLCGISCVLALVPQEGRGVRLLLGSVCGSVLLQWCPVLFAFFLEFTLPAHFCGAALACLLGVAGFWQYKRHGARSPGGGESLLSLLRRRKFLWGVLAVLGVYCFLVWKSFLFEGGRVYSSQATYGDMSMHLSFLTSLKEQGTFPPDYSLLPGAKLSYPFLSDSISSSLYLLGAPLKFAYVLPMCAAGAQVLFGCCLFFLRMLGNSSGRTALALVFFFFNGGLGILYFLGGEPENFVRLFTAFYETPTNLVGEEIRWVNVIVDMMLPQRATLFGWAVLFPLLFLLYRAVFEGERRYFLYAGVLAGTLPMIHTHSFLAFAVVCGGWLFFSLLNGLDLGRIAVRTGKWCVGLGLLVMGAVKALLQANGLRDAPQLLWTAGGLLLLFFAFVCLLLWMACRRGGGGLLLHTWGALFLSACALALPQLIFWTFDQAKTGGFVRGRFGWCIGEDGYLLFYLKNIGLAGILALLGLLQAKRREFMKYAPALFLWLMAELVVFQPNEYDNNKLLYPAFAFLCCAASNCTFTLLEKLKGKAARKGAAVSLAALCSVSAVLTMGRETVSRYELYGSGAVELAEFVEEQIPADAVVLTDLRHNNEITCLAGRNIVCGSPSYLYYHGLNYQENALAVQAMYESPAASQGLFSRYQVDYMLVSDYERNSFQVDEQSLEEKYPCVYDDGCRKLYQVTKRET